MSGAAAVAPLLPTEGLCAGYGVTEVVHDLDLALAPGEALCLVGPNGGGKSTVLNAVFGFADVARGRVVVNGRDVTRVPPAAKLARAGIAYVLQGSSIFPDLSVEENVRLGAYVERDAGVVNEALERTFERHPRLAQRRREPARVLSGGERRLLEIARALLVQPRLLLIDEPSLGLEPRYIDLVFETLETLKAREGTAILLVEQNARKALAFADTGCVMVAGRVVMSAAGHELAADPAVGRLYLGGA